MPSWKRVIVSGSSAHLSSLALDTDLAVAHGGTGASTLTSGYALLGNGTSAPQMINSTADSTMLVGNGSTMVAETGGTLRTSIGVDPTGTDNSTDVTLAGSYDYITISGQAITRNQIDLTTDVTGVLPSANLDSDTAHLTTTQTFSGAKSFTLAVNIDATTAASSKTTGALIVDGGVGVALDVHAGGDVVAYASSDERLKDNLQVIKGSLDKIGEINGYEFDWNDKSPEWAQKRGHDIGVVAQEIQKVLPEIVTERTNGYLGVDYKRIIPLLIESIKELKQEVEDLKKKVN